MSWFGFSLSVFVLCIQWELLHQDQADLLRFLLVMIPCRHSVMGSGTRNQIVAADPSLVMIPVDLLEGKK